jgi:pimeloyl-ACP methyl ester carboxylesterase
MADLFARLMTGVLGYPRFAAQGGDWGGYVVGRLAHAHPDKLVGVHLNFLPLPALVRRTGLQHPALDGAATRRTLRGTGSPDLLATDVTTFFRRLRGGRPPDDV